MSGERRARVQGQGISLAHDGDDYRPYGTVGWAEHVEAWEAYHKRWPNHQTAEIIHERGGFGYREITMLLGHEPTTWEPRP